MRFGGIFNWISSSSRKTVARNPPPQNTSPPPNDDRNKKDEAQKIHKVHIFSRNTCSYSRKAEILAKKMHSECKGPRSGTLIFVAAEPPQITVVKKTSNISQDVKKFTTSDVARYPRCIDEGSQKHGTFPAVVAEITPGDYRFLGGYDELTRWASKPSHGTRRRQRGI